MRLIRRSRILGFTLVELAIVVGISGLLFAGLWRLMASGNSQLREQAAADQMSQVVTATRAFLASAQGQALLTAMDATVAGVGPAAQVQALTIPPDPANPAGSAGCVGTMPASMTTFCNFLPAGFSTATTNAYNQTYGIWIRKLDAVAGAVPQNYDFLIMTAGGDTIADNAGGRISAGIGSNGGFIYAANVCGAPAANFACGAFGSYAFSIPAASPAGYAIASAGAGHLAVMTNRASGNSTNANWLARVAIPGDTLSSLGPNTFNTMQVDLNIGSGAAPINLHMRPSGGAGGALNMNNGPINMGGGTVNLQNGALAGPGFINLSNTAPSATPLTLNTNVGGAAGTAATVLQLTGDSCDVTDPLVIGCNAALRVNGSVDVLQGLSIFATGKANTFEAATFVYNSDIRMKKDLVPITGALDKISRMQGYRFRWNKDGRDDLGVVAQDVQKVFPELVHQTGDGRLGVEYGNLIAPIIEAIKELRQENEALRNQIKAQQRSLERLQKKDGTRS